MIQAAPLVLSFARAVPMLNKLIGAVGITELGNRVNNYIQENPDESEKIVSMIMPTQGIANALKNKSSEDVEEVEETEEVSTGSGVEEKIKEILVGEGVDIEGVDLGELPKDLQGKVMKGIAKSSTNKKEDMKEASAIIGLSGPARETKKMADEIDDRYEGGLEEVTKTKGYDFRDYIPKGAYKKRYADGGAIGIEVLFENKNPRQGLFMGGSPLEGQALSIYNSMNAYGFDDQAIANALQEQGLYTPGGSTPDPTPDPTPDTGQTIGYQGGSDNFSPYNPDPNSIKPFKPMGANFQNQKPNAFSTGIAKMIDNPIIKTLGFAMNPPLGFAKAILSKAGSMMPVNERSIFENLAGNTGVRVNDIGQIVNTGKYNTPEGVMAGYNLNKVTDKTFDKRTDRIEKTLSEKYGLTAEEIEDVKAGTYTGKKGFNTTMGTTTNLFSQLRNILSAKNTIMSQKNIAAQMAKQQREAKAAADALAIQQSGLTDLGNIQKIQQYTGQPLSDYRMSRPASERNYTGGSTNSNPSTPGAQDGFSNKSGMGRTGYKDGGLAMMFTRRR